MMDGSNGSSISVLFLLQDDRASGLNKEQRRRLHDAGGGDLPCDELLDLAKAMFDK